MSSISLVQLNDVHGYLEPHQEVFRDARGFAYREAGGYARIATLLDEIRRERDGQVLVLDGGDTFHGTHPVVDTQGATLPPILNDLGIDAMTAHWEFAYGPEVLKERVADLQYPLLAANIFREGTDDRPYPATMVREVGDVRVGVIGLASHIVDKTMPPHFSKGLRFEVGNERLPALIDDVRSNERVDLVVVLSHLGFPQDMQLAREVDGIDVIVSSHTHNRLTRPAVANGTLVIQSGSHGSFVGRLDLEIEGGKIVDHAHRLITVDDAIAADAEMARRIDDALSPYREQLAEVVGRTETGLNRATSVESTMDTFILDALRHHTGAQVAFSNGWRYGAPVSPGEITMNDLWNMVPMDPPVSTVTLRGDEIVEMLEENLERTYAHNAYDQMGGYVKRMGGARAYVRVENPRGTRIQRLFIGDEPVTPSQEYEAVFITAQGVAPEYGRNRQQLDEGTIAVLRRYVEAQAVVNADPHGSFVLV